MYINYYLIRHFILQCIKCPKSYQIGFHLCEQQTIHHLGQIFVKIRGHHLVVVDLVLFIMLCTFIILCCSLWMARGKLFCQLRIAKSRFLHACRFHSRNEVPELHIQFIRMQINPWLPLEHVSLPTHPFFLARTFTHFRYRYKHSRRYIMNYTLQSVVKALINARPFINTYHSVGRCAALLAAWIFYQYAVHAWIMHVAQTDDVETPGCANWFPFFTPTHIHTQQCREDAWSR
jgi:hypothetical protein